MLLAGFFFAPNTPTRIIQLSNRQVQKLRVVSAEHALVGWIYLPGHYVAGCQLTSESWHGTPWAGVGTRNGSRYAIPPASFSDALGHRVDHASSHGEDMDVRQGESSKLRDYIQELIASAPPSPLRVLRTPFVCVTRAIGAHASPQSLKGNAGELGLVAG